MQTLLKFSLFVPILLHCRRIRYRAVATSSSASIQLKINHVILHSIFVNQFNSKRCYVTIWYKCAEITGKRLNIATMHHNYKPTTDCEIQIGSLLWIQQYSKSWIKCWYIWQNYKWFTMTSAFFVSKFRLFTVPVECEAISVCWFMELLEISEIRLLQLPG